LFAAGAAGGNRWMVAVLGLIVTGISPASPPRKQPAGAIFLFSAVLLSLGFPGVAPPATPARNTRSPLPSLPKKEQSETLLKEILPPTSSNASATAPKNIAESMSEVNVIFIDMVGFTAMSRKLAPQHLVEVLGEMFRSFDALSEQHSVTKIKTIGDAYMAAPARPNLAPQRCKRSGVLLRRHTLSRRDRTRTGIPLQVRVGVATGAAISGVLSLKRPAL